MPQVSVARQVRVTLKSFGQRGTAAFVTVLTTTMRTLFRSHLSTAVGMSKAQSVPHSTSLSGPQVRFGGSVSTIVTVWLQKAELPQVSVARHVRVTLKILGQRGTAALVTVLTTSISTLFKSQRSVAVGMSKAQSVPHCTLLSEPQARAGGIVSTMVTVWLQKAALPQVSVARQVRVTLKILGQRGTATLVTVLTTSISTLFKSHLSTALGMSKAQAVPHSTDLSCSQVMFGGSMSTMVTVWLQKDMLPQVSVAFQVRVTLNSLGQRGRAMLVTVLTTWIRTLFESHKSTAPGMSNAQSMPQSTSLSCSQVMLGGCVSTTVTVWLQKEVLVQVSVAFHVRVTL